MLSKNPFAPYINENERRHRTPAFRHRTRRVVGPIRDGPTPHARRSVPVNMPIEGENRRSRGKTVEPPLSSPDNDRRAEGSNDRLGEVAGAASKGFVPCKTVTSVPVNFSRAVRRS
jgi:hypothetical protein